MNLVGPGDVDHHFVDAAGAVSGLKPRGRWIDLGSGAGFPGIALAARYPLVDVLLVESREKRASFLKHVAREAELSNVRIFHGRTETVKDIFDGVISRAYRPPEEYLGDADRLLKQGGVAVLLSGGTPPVFEGWVVDSIDEYPVADGMRTRTVLKRV
jgi:16S rRNA (guanine527-N7)-methyltransferase